jgi:hypothetical protein
VAIGRRLVRRVPVQGSLRCTFAQAPDEEECNGILAWHFREGNYGDVELDDLSVVAVGSFEGNIWAGEAKNSAMGFFIDERADERQRDALQAIFGGDAGGWPGAFAQLIDEVRGIEFVPIDFDVADDLSAWRVEVPGRAKGSAGALTGPTSPPGHSRASPQRSRSGDGPPGRSRRGPPPRRTTSTHSASSGAGRLAPASTSPSSGPARTSSSYFSASSIEPDPPDPEPIDSSSIAPPVASPPIEPELSPSIEPPSSIPIASIA